MIRWSVFLAVLALFGMGMALSACQDRPGDNAYGRYSNPDSSAIQPYNEDWYKDRGM